MPRSKNAPGEADLTEDAKTAPSTGGTRSPNLEEGETAPAAVVSGNATRPDDVTESARLGGQTVEELKDTDEDAGETPAQARDRKMARRSATGNLRLTPDDTKLLVGNQYTATLELDEDLDPGDVVTFMHPAGWDTKASVMGRVASGTFLIERAREFTFGFKVNGRKVASASYDSRVS